MRRDEDMPRTCPNGHQLWPVAALDPATPAGYVVTTSHALQGYAYCHTCRAMYEAVWRVARWDHMAAGVRT